MQAGKFDRRLTLRRATTSRDAFNSPVESWADLATVWASRTPISDGEQVRAAQVGGSVTDRFQIRWSAMAATLTTKDQLVCEGRTYDITGIKEIGRRVGLEITAKARA